MTCGKERRVEIAQLKRAEKKLAKEAKASAVDPTVLLARILAADPHADVYLTPLPSADGISPLGPRAADGLRSLCREHFRFESCRNRRCKWSHALSIAEASAVASERRPLDVGGADGGAGDTEPALECVRGFGPRPDRRSGSGGDSASKIKAAADKHATKHADGRRADRDSKGMGRPRPGASALFEALPDVAEDTLASLLGVGPGAGLGAAGTSCRALRISLMSSPSAVAAKAKALPKLTAARVNWLLRRANASRLRFAVSFVASSHGLVPMLAHDAEDMEVWRRFEQRASHAAQAKAAAASPACVASACSSAPAPFSLAGDLDEDAPRADGGGGGGGAATALPLDALVGREAGVAALVFAFAGPVGACGLASTSSGARAAARGDAGFRCSKREGLAGLAIANAAKGGAKTKKAKKGKVAKGPTAKVGYTRYMV